MARKLNKGLTRRKAPAGVRVLRVLEWDDGTPELEGAYVVQMTKRQWRDRPPERARAELVAEGMEKKQQ
jgi:hypothetical protein